MRAWGYEAQAAGYAADAALRESFEPSYLGAGASLLMGASSLADKWDRFEIRQLDGRTGAADFYR